MSMKSVQDPALVAPDELVVGIVGGEAILPVPKEGRLLDPNPVSGRVGRVGIVGTAVGKENPGKDGSDGSDGIDGTANPGI